MLSGHTPPPFPGSPSEDDPNWSPIADWIKQHRSELDTELPPEYGWQTIRQRLKKERPTRYGLKWFLQAGLLAAASVTMAVGLVIVIKPEVAPGAVADIIHSWQFDRNAPAEVRTIDAHYEPEIEKIQAKIHLLIPENSRQYEKQVAKLDKELNAFRAKMKLETTWSSEKVLQYENLRARQLTAYESWLKSLEKTPQVVVPAGFSVALYA